MADHDPKRRRASTSTADAKPSEPQPCAECVVKDTRLLQLSTELDEARQALRAMQSRRG